MCENDIKDFDFTEAAWESLYDAVDDTVFLEQDAEVIYNSLKHRLKFISFGDYLKRYIYLKAGLDGSFAEVPLKEYQLIIKSAFSDNNTPPSFTPTTAKLSALTKNWLTQQTVKRKVVFLLGFGLKMSVEDVNLFLTKALREPEINPKDPFEVICWYCYKNGYTYPKFEKLWELYSNTSTNANDMELIYSEHTIGVRNSMYSVRDDASLLTHLSKLKTSDNVSRISVTVKECFERLYDEARDLIAALYNQTEDEQHFNALFEYRDKLSRNNRLYDFEKVERIKRFKAEKRYLHGQILPKAISSISYVRQFRPIGTAT